MASKNVRWIGGRAGYAAAPLFGGIPLQDVHPLASLTAFALLILWAFLRLSPRVEAHRRPYRLVVLWLLAAATVLLWAGCVVALHARGMPW
jgi:hypothetical protein